ncbi:acetyl-CoA hydrolase/transferase C-terminal domain-containing protein [Phenylobacterium sp.]|uniref:acetyl-CoA hydrolase/transferase family protein n=1 Tax=Phenylobacterium sp. TaxID=1871053 RepID=UPI00301BF7BB
MAGDIDLSGLIGPGDRVVISQGCAEPQTLCEALVAAAAETGPFETFVGPLFSKTFDGAQMQFASYGAMGRAARLARAGRLDIWPLHYSEVSQAFATGRIRADVVLLQLARAPDGRLGATLSNDYALAAASSARVVLAEINAQAPWCCGAELDPDLRIDRLIETDRPLVALDSPPLGDAERAIGRHVAGLVPDGATLQLGIGALPDAILEALTGHRDLGVHSGMIADGLVPLLEAGVVTNARKSRDRGVTVTNTAFGTRRLFDFVDRNAEVRLAPAAYTHSFEAVAGQAGIVAINAALEVDLEGNVNCEVSEGRMLGGTGGLLDFTRGARAADRGRAVTVLRATDRTGAVNRIVPRVAAVTVPKTDVDVVVTEFGVADLRGLGRRGRAEALIAIAPPSAREALAEACR